MQTVNILSVCDNLNLNDIFFKKRIYEPCPIDQVTLCDNSHCLKAVSYCHKEFHRKCDMGFESLSVFIEQVIN